MKTIEIYKRFSHWTPIYILDRIRLFIDQVFNPNDPWWSRDAIDVVEQILHEDDIALEFGSGRSTIWIGQRVKKVTSVEHNKSWFEKVSTSIDKQGINNIDLSLYSSENYLSVLGGFEHNSLDFVVVDGIKRGECALKSFPILKKGGVMVIDDAHRFFPSQSRAPYSRRNSYKDKIWQEVAELIRGSRKIWVGDGVTETLIIIKDCT